jgi:hypothetical protein
MITLYDTSRWDSSVCLDWATPHRIGYRGMIIIVESKSLVVVWDRTFPLFECPVTATKELMSVIIGGWRLHNDAKAGT